MGAARRLLPSGFVDLPGNRLDDFQSEHDAPALEPRAVATPLPTPEAPQPLAPLNELFVTVEAYPEEEPYPTCLASRRAPEPSRRSVVRMVIAWTWRAAGIALTPLLLVLWLAQRTWWLVWWSAYGAWRGVVGTVYGIGAAIAATVRGLANAIAATMALLAGAVVSVGRGTSTGLVFAWNRTVAGLASGRNRVVAGATAAAAFANARVRAAWTGVRYTAKASVTAILTSTRRAAHSLATTAAHGVAGTTAFMAAGARAGRSAARGASTGVDAASEGLRAGVARARTLAGLVHRALRGTTARSMAFTTSWLAAGSVATAAREMTRLAAATRRTAAAWQRVNASLRGWGAHAWASALVYAGHVARHASTAASVASDTRTGLVSIARHERTVVRVALAGVPPWARHASTGTALAIISAVAIGASGALLMIVIALRPVPQVALAPQPAASFHAALSIAPVAAREVEPTPRRAAQPPAAPAAKRTPIAGPRREAAPARERGVSADSLRAIWSRTDTRSLQRGLAALRSETLAFHRCEMQRTADDVAVAHCDEVRTVAAAARRVAWTIDFRRADEGWVIAGLSSNESVRAAR